MPSPDIVCLGEPLIEFNQIDACGHFLRGYGGDTSNCAIAASRAGASTGYVTAIGQDEFGDGLMRLWADNGVDTSVVTRRMDAHTGVYFVTHAENGHTFSYIREGSAASRMEPRTLPRAYIANSKVLHLSAVRHQIK